MVHQKNRIPCCAPHGCRAWAGRRVGSIRWLFGSVSSISLHGFDCMAFHIRATGSDSQPAENRQRRDAYSAPGEDELDTNGSLECESRCSFNLHDKTNSLAVQTNWIYSWLAHLQTQRVALIAAGANGKGSSTPYPNHIDLMTIRHKAWKYEPNLILICYLIISRVVANTAF